MARQVLASRSAKLIAAAWNIQGDPARASFIDEVRRVFDIALPTSPNTIAVSADFTAIWLGPRSWLLASVGASSLVDYIQKRDAINAAGGALFDVSGSHIAWHVSGPRATIVLAKSCPLDFHPHAFSADTCAQSHIGHVNALFVKHDDAPTFTVMVARSFASVAFGILMRPNFPPVRMGVRMAPGQSTETRTP
jgi:sarcosine oxidase subunit gamma